MNHYTNKTRMSGKIKHQENDQHSISPYYDYTPEDCNYMGFIFIYLTVLFVSGIILNTALLYKFVTIKSLRIPVNTFLAAILVCNLISIFFYLPITISSNYYCFWIFSYLVCELSAFTIFFTSATSIFLITVISYERYYMIHQPMKFCKLKFETTIKIVAFCYLLGFFVAVLPLLGWSYYSHEASKASCSVEWQEFSLNVTSYNIFILLLVFFIPFTTIIIFSVKTYKKLHEFNGNKIYGVSEAERKRYMRRKQGEKNMFISMIILIIGFFFSWSPYAMFSIYCMIIPNPSLNTLSTVPSLFAKSTFVWTPIFIMFKNRNFARKLTINTQNTATRTNGSTALELIAKQSLRVRETNV